MTCTRLAAWANFCGFLGQADRNLPPTQRPPWCVLASGVVCITRASNRDPGFLDSVLYREFGDVGAIFDSLCWSFPEVYYLLARKEQRQKS